MFKQTQSRMDFLCSFLGERKKHGAGGLRRDQWDNLSR